MRGPYTSAADTLAPHRRAAGRLLPKSNVNGKEDSDQAARARTGERFHLVSLLPRTVCAGAPPAVRHASALVRLLRLPTAMPDPPGCPHAPPRCLCPPPAPVAPLQLEQAAPTEHPPHRSPTPDPLHSEHAAPTNPGAAWHSCSLAFRPHPWAHPSQRPPPRLRPPSRSRSLPLPSPAPAPPSLPPPLRPLRRPPPGAPPAQGDRRSRWRHQRARAHTRRPARPQSAGSCCHARRP